MKINTLVVKTKTDLLKVINESGLPITVVSLILSELQAAINQQINITLQQEEQEAMTEAANNKEAAKNKEGSAHG